MSRGAVAAGAVIAALTVSAALGGPAVVGPAGADGAGGGTNPCTVLKRAEIAAAFGQPVSKGSNGLGTAFCQWDLAPTADRAAGQVNVLVEHGKVAKRDYRLIVDGPEALEPVAGIGRTAFFAPSTGTLFVRAKGPTFFYVQANLYADVTTRVTDGVEQGLVQLASRAEARV